MIALIAIPHQTPAEIHWYEDEAAVLSAAIEYAEASGRAEPDDYNDAVHLLADDWHSYLLVESAADLDAVRAYIAPDGRPGGRRHQAHRIAAMLDELTEEFS